MGQFSRKEIGKRIALIRAGHNMTQQEIGEKLNVSRETVNYWENGSRAIKAEHILMLSEILGVSCNFLLGTDGNTLAEEKIMPKYVEAVKCAEVISERFGIPLADLVDVFAEIPSANVAPKLIITKLKKDGQ